jgi:hypothetical protein
MTKLSLGLAFITIASVAILSGCDHPDSTTRTNPDFNRKSVFTDYGTYGRTVYFEDDKGDTWCYYDLLTFNNPEYIELTVSHPMPVNCSLDQGLHIVTIRPAITGEKSSSDGGVTVSTVFYPNVKIDDHKVFPADNSDPENPTTLREIHPSVGILTGMIPLAFMGSFKTIANLNLDYVDGALYGNIIYAGDYFYFGISDPEDMDYTGIDVSNFVYGFSIDNQEPDPDITRPFQVTANTERAALYMDSPFQRLSPSEDNPYPLNQIEVSSVVN